MSRFWLLLVAAVVVAGLGYFFLPESDAPQVTETAAALAPAAPAAAPETIAQDEPADEPAPEPEVDLNRLFHPSFQNDPELIAFAKEANTTPACLIEMMKNYWFGTPEPPFPECPEPEPPEEDPLDVRAENHPYTTYTNTELRDLAAADADAAVILARRLWDGLGEGRQTEASLQWYEQAVIVSGKPDALFEWIVQNNHSGIGYTNDELHVESASIGYEMFLTMQKIGFKGSVTPWEEALTNAGVDLAPIQARAEARFARLTEARQQLIGANWDGV